MRMSTLVACLAALTLLVLVVGAVFGARAFLRATTGAQGLRARIARLFLLPVRQRPLPRGHYYKAYWRERGDS
jgi:uncharacterized membrane protein